MNSELSSNFFSFPIIGKTLIKTVKYLKGVSLIKNKIFFPKKTFKCLFSLLGILPSKEKSIVKG